MWHGKIVSSSIWVVDFSNKNKSLFWFFILLWKELENKDRNYKRKLGIGHALFFLSSRPSLLTITSLTRTPLQVRIFWISFTNPLFPLLSLAPCPLFTTFKIFWNFLYLFYLFSEFDSSNFILLQASCSCVAQIKYVEVDFVRVCSFVLFFAIADVKIESWSELDGPSKDLA